ncbi:MAG: protein-disulfide reductase DsbD domain-containing protein [Terracidiphilus sp.]
MIALKTGIQIAAAVALTLALGLAEGQRPLIDGLERPASKPQSVEFLFPEQITLPADKATLVALHFRVAPGLHINSHAPAAEELIPTTFTLPADSGVRLIAVSYPPGAAFTLPLDPTTKLSVYSGEFTLEARIQATRGNHLVEATLRYQACDNSLCMPPKTIPVVMDVIGE